MARSKNVFVQLRPSSNLWAWILQHFQMYTCTFFVAMPSQSPSLPFDSVQVCLHGRECVDIGQQANMWFYTYSSMLCPQRVKNKKKPMLPSANDLKAWHSLSILKWCDFILVLGSCDIKCNNNHYLATNSNFSSEKAWLKTVDPSLAVPPSSFFCWVSDHPASK